MTKEKLYPATQLPVANPTESYWLSQPHPSLENYSSGNALPADVDAVIIGSGISGALIAHGILARDPNARLLMLDARNVCNGASGRNGGHIKPDCYKNFAKYQATYGADTAKKLCRFEVENMKDCVEFIREQGLADAIDLVETRSVDFFMNDESWQDAKVSLRRYKEAGGHLGGIEVHEKHEADQKFRVQHVSGAVSYPACSLWPRKLVLCLIGRAVNAGLRLFTHTPVVRIDTASGQRQWAVKSTKGIITCDTVYHATNGYISHLLPQFIGKVVPVKGNVAAIQPSPSFDREPLGHTCGFQWGSDFDYMIQRPVDGKPLIYGGRDLLHPRSIPGVIGDSDDSVTTPEIQKGLQDFPTKYFKGWGADSKVRYAWSGIMGFTADELPFVGEVPGLPGQFVAAGFSGHGMARVFLTIKALMQIAYNEAVDPRVPPPYFEIQQRLEKKNDVWEEMLTEAYAPELAKTSRSKL